MNVKIETQNPRLSMELNRREMILIDRLNDSFYEQPETVAALGEVVGLEAAELLLDLVNEIDIAASMVRDEFFSELRYE